VLLFDGLCAGTGANAADALGDPSLVGAYQFLHNRPRLLSMHSQPYRFVRNDERVVTHTRREPQLSTGLAGGEAAE
jgi:hypothetical protein